MSHKQFCTICCRSGQISSVCVCASRGCSRRTLSYGLCMCLKIYEALHFVPAQLDSHTRLLPLSFSRWLSLPPRSQRTTAGEPLHCVWSPKHFCPIVSGTAVLLLSPDCQSVVARSNFDSQEKFLGLSWHDWSLCWQDCTGSVTGLWVQTGDVSRNPLRWAVLSPENL